MLGGSFAPHAEEKKRTGPGIEGIGLNHEGPHDIRKGLA
jgi:hypothetical protein